AYNDTRCWHRASDDLLCPACSIPVLALAHSIVGTSSVDRAAAHRAAVTIACEEAERGSMINLTHPRAAVDAARAWLANPSMATATHATHTAAGGGAPSFHGLPAGPIDLGYHVGTAFARHVCLAAGEAESHRFIGACHPTATDELTSLDNLACCHAFDATSFALAVDATSVGSVAPRLVARWMELTGWTPAPAPSPEVVADAVAKMLVTA
ncbi:MAG: hypothetical protein RJA49_2775, partial [Actinomycetota bacterium]